MPDNPDKSMSLFTALMSAVAVAAVLAYLAHSEWGLSRMAIREDAMAMAGLLVVGVGARALFQKRRDKGGS